MTVWREEIFGPVLSVCSFTTEEEAVRLANDSEFGLAGQWLAYAQGWVCCQAICLVCSRSLFPQVINQVSDLDVWAGWEGIEDTVLRNDWAAHCSMQEETCTGYEPRTHSCNTFNAKHMRMGGASGVPAVRLTAAAEA